MRTETDAKTTPSLPDLGILRRIALAMTAAFACIGAGASTAVPEQAKAIVQHGVGGLEVLKLESVPVPDVRQGEVLIRVYAAAVNPVDWKRRIGQGDYAPDPKGCQWRSLAVMYRASWSKWATVSPSSRSAIRYSRSFLEMPIA